MRLRSLLFAPADSEKKLEKALASGADGVIFDLEDSVAPERKEAARGILGTFLAALSPDVKGRVIVRINGLRTGSAPADIAVAVSGGIRGVMLPKAEGVEDIARLSTWLDMAETMAGHAAGTILVLPVVTETARAVQLTDVLTRSPETGRLAALTWGGEDLATDLGARSNRGADGNWDDVFRLARARCLLAAASCHVQAIDTLFAAYKDDKGLAIACAEARRSGFSGKIAIHPAQVPTINDAFSPSAEEIGAAEAIVAAFAAQPDAGTVGIDGVMYDRPHLLKAERVLAAVQDIRAATPVETKRTRTQ
jgi:citrate lyase subunit beta/citryl-CoA lyase